MSQYNETVEILSHEIIHAFDYCRAYLDINNNSHVACSEVFYSIYQFTFFLSFFSNENIDTGS